MKEEIFPRMFSAGVHFCNISGLAAVAASKAEFRFPAASLPTGAAVKSDAGHSESHTATLFAVLPPQTLLFVAKKLVGTPIRTVAISMHVEALIENI